MATNRTDHTDTRPIPPPPGRAAPVDGDADLDAAYDDLTVEEQRAATKAQREQFQTARRALVDLHVAAARASGVEVDYRAFHGATVDQFSEILAEHGFQSFDRIAEENLSLRAAVAHEVAQRHRHLSPQDFEDFDGGAEGFDYDRWVARAGETEQRRSEDVRGLLVDAMADLGIDTTAEDFDPLGVLQRAAAPPATAGDPAELPPGAVISTPMSRSASLPFGRDFDADRMMRSLSDDGRTGTDAIESAAAEDITSGKLRI